MPGDYIQGPTDANYMVDKLSAKKVVLIDFQEPYSVGLADAAEAILKRKGVTTIRQSTSVNTTDFSSLVTRVPSDTDVVFSRPSSRPTRRRSAAAPGAGQAGEVFGGDGANNAAAVQVNGSTSRTSPRTSAASPRRSRLVDGWKKANPKATLGSFGPPAYLATQVALQAIKRACVAGNGKMNTRRDVIRQVKKVRVPNSILGGAVPLLDEVERPAEREFYIFQIQSNGTYKLVG